MSDDKTAETTKATEADSGQKESAENGDSTEVVDMETDDVDPEAEKDKLEKEVEALEAEKQRIEKEKEREDVQKKAEEISKLINPDGESSDEETEKNTPVKQSKPDSDAPKVPFWDFALTNLLVGLGTLKIEGFNVYCGSCQKNMELDTLKFHLDGDGHKLNTLWNYDKSLAEVTGELRSYPQKFEMEMFKHITMLNRMEKRYDVEPEVAAIIRDLYKHEATKDAVKTEPEDDAPKTPVISPEELAEIKAEFIGSFPNADDAILIQQALMGELHGFSSESSAQSALRIAGMLGKLISSYQRRHFKDGYKVNEECIRDIKGQCGKLLKLIDEAKLQSQLPH